MIIAWFGPAAEQRASERVSRRVGRLVTEQAWGTGPCGDTRRLNDMDPCPRFATPSAPTRRDTRATRDPHFEASPGAISEPRPAGGPWLSLGPYNDRVAPIWTSAGSSKTRVT